MKPASSRLSRLFTSLSDLIYYRATQARIRFQEGDSNVTETSEQALLRRRVRAAALVLFLAKLAFLLRSLLLYGTAAPLDGAVLLSLFVAVAWLYSPRNTSLFWLRTVETAIFLGMSCQFGIQLHFDLRRLVLLSPETTAEVASASVSFVAAVKDQIIATFGMMMIYGMFIPNNPRRAALMVFLMAVAPGVVIAMNESSLQTIRAFREKHITATGIFSGNLLALAVGAGCAIYGTATMNRWRNRAIEAEQLGQYRLREKIGSGGMGDVYLAEHRLLKRLCAVKLIRADMSEDPVMLTRFEREVQATATLTHWNTVQVFDYGHTADGTFFYVMEHLHGRNLRQIVYEKGPLAEDRVVFILRQVCDALREAAAHELVHRDIKPSNIFLAFAGERFDVVKLLDFGLVRPLTEVTNPGLSGTNQIKGSPRYMCPEQAQGQTPDTRGDLYSLGATAYFMLTGRAPFDLQNALQLVIAHATETPPTFAQIGVNVSNELEAVIRRCLQKKPADRFQNPDELLDALENLPLAGHWTWRAAEEWWRREYRDGLHLDRTTFIDPADEATTIEESLDTALDNTVIEGPPEERTES
ncbi:MAG: serine/threonine-protein kinase [Fuerstiella sp.]